MDSANYCVIYTPNLGIIDGTDQICVSVCDGTGQCDTTIVIITIVPDTVNVPVNVDTVYVTTVEGCPSPLVP